MTKINKELLVNDLVNLGVDKGDTILIRAGLGAIGRIDGGANTFIDALLDAVGPDGTIVSLAFTSASFLRKPRKEDAFNRNKKSYAGALPNAMLNREESFRSKHPMCSYVAIGKKAQYITSDHNEKSPAYEPVRKIIELNGKNILIGCVKSSPGFTTAHLAEADLGMLSLNIFSGFTRTYYVDESGALDIFKRKDSGLCSNSFYKFYSHYVNECILKTGYIGKAYSIIAPADKCYDIEYGILLKNKKFNICDSKDCFTCNAGRWDRVHHLPWYILRKIYFKLKRVI